MTIVTPRSARLVKVPPVTTPRQSPVLRTEAVGLIVPLALTLAVPAIEIVALKTEVPEAVAVPDGAFLRSNVPDVEVVPNLRTTETTWQG
jgi:hypothetical protein